MKIGSKGYVSADEGDIYKFHGIKTKQNTKNKLECLQPFLI
jgi:hypothetical protein